MKKILLSAVSMMTVGAGFAQSTAHLTPEQNRYKVSVPVNITEQAVENAENFPLIGNTQVQQRSATETQIGESYYDLQTNSAIQRRIILHNNSSITATWTFSTDAAWTNRGTGYNYFNGTSWGSIPTAELETERTGWPNPLASGSGKEIIISHSTANSIFHKVERTTVGAGAWTQGNLSSQSGQVWGRSSIAGTNNNTIHMIGMTLPIANNGTLFNGMDGAFLYSRSTNSGSSFDIVDYQIPGTNVNYFDGFDGDSYAIDAKGDVIAIVVGGLGRGVQLFKSINNGVTWTKTDVMTSAVWFQEDLTIVDTTLEGRLWTSDGGVTVLIDDDNKANVWYSTMYIANADITDGTITYYPYTNGMYYWNEDYPSDNALRLFGFIDIDGDGLISMDNPGGQYRFAGLVSHPQAGVDEEGCFYLSYTMVREDLTTGQQNYRHTYVTKSCDGGCSWSFPIDVTGSSNNAFAECVFPSIARKVDDDVHIIYMSDAEPGIAVSGDEDTPVINKMIYLKEDAERFDTVTFCPTDIAGDSLLCAGGTVTLEALGCASAYSWTGPGSFTSTNQVVNVTATGTYTCEFTTTCGTQTETFNVVNYTGGSTPVVTIAAPTLELCPGANSTLTANSNIAGVTYLWSQASATTQTLNITGPGVYTVTVTDCSGATATQSVTVVTPAAPTAIISGDLTLCPGGTNQLNAIPVVGATNYQWSTGTTGANATSINVTAAGTYQVTITNCSGSSSASVTVTEEEEPVAVINNSGTEVCEGSVLTVYADGGTSYEWSTGSTESALSINEVSQSGTYTVTVSNDCGDEDTEEITLTVHAIPAAPSVTFNGSDYVSSQTGSGTHTWYINGVPTNETGSTLGGNNVGEGDEVYCEYTDENGCTSLASNIVLSVDDLQGLDNQLRVYPNPSNGSVELAIGDINGAMTMSVTNTLGQVVYRNVSNVNAQSIVSLDLTDLPSGTYQLNVETDSGVSVKSIIIE
ncbi:MAG: hypothetical protein Salg2KO_07170 [Salibacteraceae bacterium]